MMDAMKLFYTLSLVISTTKSVMNSRRSPNSVLSLFNAQKSIIRDMPWSLRASFYKEHLFNDHAVTTPASSLYIEEDTKIRQVGLQALSLPLPSRRQAQDTENDDNSMKMKLFRLMYETVRDSDLKVKRAELIKRFYTNSSSFEIGYLLGDVTDKFNVMSDITLTLKRLYHEWKPIEHINAYEQVANLAIEISHIVDLINGVEKKLRQEEAEPDVSEQKPKNPDKTLLVF